jgi:hypothetical protein
MAPPRPAKPATRIFNLRLLSFRGLPLRAKGTLDWGTETILVCSDNDGHLHEIENIIEETNTIVLVPGGVTIPLTPDNGTLNLKAFNQAPFELQYKVFLSKHGDASTADGAGARLHNLGFLSLSNDDPSKALPKTVDDALVRALNRFQTATGLTVSSGTTIDNATRDRLADAHDKSGNLGTV